MNLTCLSTSHQRHSCITTDACFCRAAHLTHGIVYDCSYSFANVYPKSWSVSYRKPVPRRIEGREQSNRQAGQVASVRARRQTLSQVLARASSRPWSTLRASSSIRYIYLSLTAKSIRSSLSPSDFNTTSMPRRHLSTDALVSANIASASSSDVHCSSASRVSNISIRKPEWSGVLSSLPSSSSAVDPRMRICGRSRRVSSCVVDMSPENQFAAQNQMRLKTEQNRVKCD